MFGTLNPDAWMRTTSIALVLGFAAVMPLQAQIPASEYAARRDSLAAHLGEGVLLAFGAREPTDDLGSSRQLPGFAYLTSFAEPDAALVLIVRAGKLERAQLYLPSKDPRMALYTGFLPSAEEVREKYGLELRTMDRLRATIDSLTAQTPTLWNLPDVASRDYLRDDSLTRGTAFLNQFRTANPLVTVKSAQSPLDSLRVRKSSAEVAMIRRAVQITMQGHEAAIRAIAPSQSEAVAQAEAERVFRTLGDGPAYGTIVGSGPNSTSYHYHANNRTMRAGDVVVMDMAAMYQGYDADITRTAPVSGTFTPDQRRIYDLVLASQKAAEALAGPNRPVAEGDSAMRAVQADGLTKLGLIESPDAMIDPPWPTDCNRRPRACRQAFLYMAHGLGHGIGLETHDVGGYSYSETGRFQVGETFTIEPGIYISTKLLDMLPDTPRNRAFITKVRPAVEKYNNTGIRIEDDFVITQRGVERLSGAPREAAEIEALMRPRGRPR